MRTKLREGETIVMATQRHPVGVLSLYALALVLLILSIWFHNAKVGRYVIYLCLAAAILSVFKTLAWQRHIWIITDERVVDEQGILTIRSTECPLDKITNVTVSQSVSGRVLGYGRIQIQTPGRGGINEEARLMRPIDFQNNIFEQQERFREKTTQPQGRMPSAEAPNQEDMKECPFCAEWIKSKAKICRFCGRDLPTEC